MASFSTGTNTSSSSSNASSNIASRELNLIASSFVKQYYTLLNKAPCFIHNFYSQYSTFIHGAIEMANEHFTEPIVGREKIQSKMEEMKLNDCRAKIKQIDCLETLAGGLVIQVIGELSNNGKPMRRFLQTFVLAPSPDETRQDGKDSVHQRGTGTNDSRRGVHLNENNASSSSNQKFFVLNSIFRYQDDGPDSESEDDVVGVQANISIDGSNSTGDHAKEARKSTQATPTVSAAGPAAPPPSVTPTATAHAKAHQKPINNEAESMRRTGEAGGGDGVRIVPNGTGSNDKKSETSEKSATENGKSALDQSQKSMNSTSSAQGIQTPASTTPSAATSQSKPITTATATPTTTTTTTTTTPTAAAAPRPQPTSEPKTWANMVSRNAHPPPATVQSSTIGTKSIHPDQQHQNQPSHHQQSQQQHQQQSHHQHQIQSQSDQQPNSNNNNINNNTNTTNNNNNNNNNNNSNNRRRHMLRKPSNKSNGGGGGSAGGGGGGSGGGGSGGSGGGAGGSRLKNRDRPRPPATGK